MECVDCGGDGVVSSFIYSSNTLPGTNMGSGTWPLGRPFSSINRVFSASMSVPGSVLVSVWAQRII